MTFFFLSLSQHAASLFLPGLKEDRQKRESGYFSLGRATGASFLRDSSPPAPFRHFERGHPIFSKRSVEPKDTVPFRNPNLGVASERQIQKDLNEDLQEEILPPDPHEIAVNVEAQVGPRSPSPTPFKIAESLASTGRKSISSSYGRRSPPPQVSSYQHSGRFDSSRQSSALQSRSSSPSRGNLPFRRSESTASLSRQNFDNGARSQGMEMGSRNFQNTQGRRVESGTLPRSFKSYASSVKSQPSTISDFRSALRKTEASGTLSGRGLHSRSSSPSRRDFNSSNQMSPHRLTGSSSNGHVRDSRNSSPSRRTSSSLRDSPSSSPTREYHKKSYGMSGQSLLRKSESVLSLSGHSHHGRCGSPIREGYDIESQTLLRNQIARNGMNDPEEEVPIISPPRRGHDTGSPGRSSRSSSPGKRGYETPNQYQLRKADSSGSLRGHNRDSPISSRRSYEAPSQAVLRKSEVNTSVRSRDGYGSLPSRKSYDASSQQAAWSSRSTNGKNHNSRNSSPCRIGNSDPPGYSILRHATNGESSHPFQKKNTCRESKLDSNRSTFSSRDSTNSHRSSSLSRAALPPRQSSSGSKPFVTWERPRSSSSTRTGGGRHGHEDQRLHDKRSSHRTRSPSPSPPVQMRRHTSSQSSLESSESGQPSLGSTGRNREEYAMLADVPKVKMIHQREGPGPAAWTQSQQASRRQELFKPARSDSYWYKGMLLMNCFKSKWPFFFLRHQTEFIRPTSFSCLSATP